MIETQPPDPPVPVIGKRYFDIISQSLVTVVAGMQPTGHVTVARNAHCKESCCSWIVVVPVTDLRNVLGY